MYFILFYDYVDNMLERRQPYRAEHLALARDYAERSELVMAGAYADPVDGAALVFRVDEQADVEAFTERDPYVRNGLVTGWRIREWTVVLGGDQGAD
ncbi:MAG: YciI-like protein [Gammaproteobacteria bacterium]